MDRRPRSPIQSAFLGEDRPDALLGAQPCDAVLPGGDPAPGRFVGDEPVAEGGVVGMDVAGGVDQVVIILISLQHRHFAPFVKPLGGETQDPAGHHDGHAAIGKVEDQRVHHFGLASRDR